MIVEGEFGTAMAHQGYIEPHASTAQWQPDGELIVWTTTQGAFAVRDLTAQMLELPVSRVKVIPTEIGGGFGGKTKLYLEPIAAILSKKAGRPVQLVMTRTEVMEASGPTSGTHLRAKIGANRDGTIVALEGHFAYEAGAYPGSPYAAGARCAFGPYDVPNQYVEAWDVVLNKPAVAAYRAPGAPASEFAVESLIDELAERLEMDPIDLRLKNAAKQGTRRVDGAAFGVIGASRGHGGRPAERPLPLRAAGRAPRPRRQRSASGSTAATSPAPTPTSTPTAPSAWCSARSTSAASAPRWR